MMAVITIFVILIFFILLAMAVGAYLAWNKISVYLTYNTRYSGAEYELAVTNRKTPKPNGQPSIAEQRGRQVKPVEELVDMADLDPLVGMEAVERLGQ